MRTLRFAKVAAEAERLRLTHMARRYAMRAVMAVIATVFLIAMLAMAHLAAWLALVQTMAPVWAALVLVGADLLLALVFALIAANSGAGAAEREAKALRVMAVMQLTRPASVMALLADRLLRLLAARLFARAR
jgi:hypothetical protein